MLHFQYRGSTSFRKLEERFDADLFDFLTDFFLPTFALAFFEMVEEFFGGDFVLEDDFIGVHPLQCVKQILCLYLNFHSAVGES